MGSSRYTALDADLFGDHRYAENYIVDENGVLTVVLEDESGKRLKISFDAYLAFRKIDEGDALHTLVDISKTSVLRTGLYLVEESEYLRWFHFESKSIHESQKLAHYCLSTVDSVIDVISFDPPNVSEA